MLRQLGRLTGGLRAGDRVPVASPVPDSEDDGYVYGRRSRTRRR